MIKLRVDFRKSRTQPAMAEITLRILDGADRGRVYENLSPPVTIGREEGNSIQINDERISRFHVKIQEDHEKIVLTDLESTNGTKVNGEDIQLRILRHGDMIALGRSVLLYGSPEEINRRLAEIGAAEGNGVDNSVSLDASDFDSGLEENPAWQAALHSSEPPELPERLTPAQAAQLAELIDYVHVRLRDLLATVEIDSRSEEVALNAQKWQNLLDLQAQLARYYREVGEPDS
jgi:pSer/pThr/pTyr-binding forkhead associated (FHA) protein